MDKNNKFLIDWFAFTSPIHSPQSIMEFIGCEHLKFIDAQRGWYFYKNRIFNDGISILSNNSNISTPGIMVEMSGQGCRNFETHSKLSFEQLIREICLDRDNYNATRIDIAFDDFTGLIPGDKLFLDMMSNNFVTKFDSDRSLAMVHPGYRGFTFNFGSPSSDVFFRIYDKAYERGFIKPEDYFHWYRWETQFKKDRANALLDLLDCDFENIGGIYTGIINNYLRFVTPSKTDSNKRRWATRPWFKKFINTTEKISVFTKCETEYNLHNLQDYVIRTAGSSIKTYIALVGEEKFYKDLADNNHKLPDKYKTLLSQEGKSEENIIEFLAKRGIT